MAIRARPDNLSLDHVVGRCDAFDFDEWWDLRDDLRTACLRIVGDAGKADDIVQDTFLRALTNVGHLHRRTSFAPWLATVARRRSIDELRAGKRVRLVAATPEPPPTHRADPLEHVLRHEAIERVRTALDTLSPRERQLLLRQVMHGLSLAELAHEEATSIGSVRSVLARARTKLRTAVEKDGPLGVAPPAGLVAAVKRRLHRWANRLDGRTSLLTGAGAQLGEMVVAVVATAALVMTGTAAAPASADTTRLPYSDASASRDASDAQGGSDSSTIARPSGQAPASSTTTTTSSTPSTIVPAPGSSVDVPWIPDRGAAQPDVVQIQSFAASADGQVVLAGGPSETGGVASLYRSTDAGHSWHKLPGAGFTEGRLLVAPSYPVDPTILVARGGLPLLRSDDDGEMFRPTTASTLGTAAALVPGFGPGRRRVLLATPAVVEYDVDTERSGAPSAAPAAAKIGGLAPTARFPLDPTVLVGGYTRSSSGFVGAVFRCDRSAIAPCEQTVLPGSATAPGIHVSSSVPGAVLAHAVEALYRSSNGGLTFSRVPLPPGYKVETAVDGAPGELLLAATKPANAPGSGILRSTDGGVTWTPLGTTTPLASGAKTVLRLANGRILVATHPDGGLLCSTDNGATWAPRCP